MSLEQHAFISKSLVPSPTQWQAAIDTLGLPFSIDPELKPFEDSGFLPCTLKNNESGFEIYYQSAAEVIQHYPQHKGLIGDRDHCISFRWGGDMAECACVVIASAALGKDFGAIVYYPDDDMIYSTDALLADAAEALKHVK